MDKEAFNRQLKEETEWIGKITREFLPKDIVYQKTIADAMEYSLMAGGKRLRPMIMWERESRSEAGPAGIRSIRRLPIIK